MNDSAKSYVKGLPCAMIQTERKTERYKDRERGGGLKHICDEAREIKVEYQLPQQSNTTIAFLYLNKFHKMECIDCAVCCSCWPDLLWNITDTRSHYVWRICGKHRPKYSWTNEAQKICSHTKIWTKTKEQCLWYAINSILSINNWQLTYLHLFPFASI